MTSHKVVIISYKGTRLKQKALTELGCKLFVGSEKSRLTL